MNNKRLTQKLGIRLREFVKNNRWDPTKADSDNQVHDALDALEAERERAEKAEAELQKVNAVIKEQKL